MLFPVTPARDGPTDFPGAVSHQGEGLLLHDLRCVGAGLLLHGGRDDVPVDVELLLAAVGHLKYLRHL